MCSLTSKISEHHLTIEDVQHLLSCGYRITPGRLPNPVRAHISPAVAALPSFPPDIARRRRRLVSGVCVCVRSPISGCWLCVCRCGAVVPHCAAVLLWPAAEDCCGSLLVRRVWTAPSSAYRRPERDPQGENSRLHFQNGHGSGTCNTLSALRRKSVPVCLICQLFTEAVDTEASHHWLVAFFVWCSSSKVLGI